MPCRSIHPVSTASVEPTLPDSPLSVDFQSSQFADFVPSELAPVHTSPETFFPSGPSAIGAFSCPPTSFWVDSTTATPEGRRHPPLPMSGDTPSSKKRKATHVR